MSKQTSTAKLVRTDQVMQLYDRLPLAAVTTYLIATIFVAAQWPVIRHSILLGWWGAMVTLTSARLWLAFRFRRAKPTSANIETWAARFFTGTLCSGLGWGTAAFFLFPENEQALLHQFVLIFVMAGMSSASITTLTAVWKNISAFLTLMLVPLIVRFSLVGGKIYLLMAAMLLLYLIGLTFSARRMHSAIQEVLTLRITDLQQEAKVMEGEEKYRTLVERSNDGIVIIENRRIKYANKQMAEMGGYNAEELKDTPFTGYIHPDELPKVVDTYERRMAGEDVPSIYETVLKHKDGHKLHVEINVGIIKYEGKPAELAFVRDISERKRAGEALRESEKLYRLLAENTSDIIFLLGMDLSNMYVSPSVEKLRGFTLEEHMKQPIEETMTPESYREMINIYRQKLEELKTLPKDARVSAIIEIEYLCKDGSTAWGEVSAALVRDGDGQPVGIQGTVRDITERKHMEAQIRAALKEKEILLKEIHHRVKNNLQIISSLLNLQAGYTRDKKMLEIFKNSRERVYAMALIHEKLYQSEDFSKIDFPEYIRSLTSYLFNSYSLVQGQVRLKMQVEDVALDMETAIPLGLIINELVSNSLQHAFPAGRKGELLVALGKSDNEKHDYTLTVSDDGIGFPAGLDFRDSDSLGMLMVNSLANKLHGVIDIQRKAGTTFTINFKKLEQRKNKNGQHS